MDQKTKDLNEVCEAQRELIDDLSNRISALVAEKNKSESTVAELSQHLVELGATERIKVAERGGISIYGPAVEQQPIGEAGCMPGTSGYTMAVFREADAPVGTQLYKAPFVQPVVTQQHARPYFGYSDEAAAIEAAKTLSMIGVPLNEHGAVGLMYAFVKLRGEQHAQAASTPEIPDNSGAQAALSDEDCDNVAQRHLTVDAFNRYLNGDLVKLYAGNIRQIILFAIQQPAAAQQEVNAALDRADAEDAARYPVAAPAIQVQEGAALSKADASAFYDQNRERFLGMMSEHEIVQECFTYARSALAAPSPVQPAPVADAAPVDPIVEMNVAFLRQRSAVGVKKYGATMADADLDLRAWLSHALEEGLDQVNYLQAAIQKLPTETPAQGDALSQQVERDLIVARAIRDAIFCTGNPCGTDSDLRRAIAAKPSEAA